MSNYFDLEKAADVAYGWYLCEQMTGEVDPSRWSSDGRLNFVHELVKKASVSDYMLCELYSEATTRIVESGHGHKLLMASADSEAQRLMAQFIMEFLSDEIGQICQRLEADLRKDAPLRGFEHG